MAFKDVEYSSVSSEDTGVETNEKELPPPPSRTNWTTYGLMLLAIVASIGLGIFIGSLRPLHISTSSTPLKSSIDIPQPGITDCGDSSADAIARGCVMDPMMYGWMPPHCQYSEVTDNYSFSKWIWYADENMTKPLTEEDLWQGKELEIWTAQAGYHTEHCLFLWEKSAYAQKRRLPWLDRKSLRFDHAQHCIEQLKDLGEGINPVTMATLGIYECDPTPWRQ